MLLEVQKIFDEFISDTFKEKQQLQQFFLRHERKKLCLENLCEEIKLAEGLLAQKFNGEKYRDMIRQVAKMFCHAALGTKENELASSAEKARRRIAPEQLLHELQAEINEENAKVHRGQIIGAGWKPVAASTPNGASPKQRTPKLLLP